MDTIILTAMLSQILQSISLVEIEGVSRLRPVVNPDNLKASQGVPAGAASSPTEQVQQFRSRTVARHRITPSLWLASSDGFPISSG